MHITFYTDASSPTGSTNPFAVWGFLAIDDLGYEVKRSGVSDNLDQNGGEILAIIEAFDFALRDIAITKLSLYTDCIHGFNALNGRLQELADRNWTTPIDKRTGKPKRIAHNKSPYSKAFGGSCTTIVNKGLYVLLYAKKLELEAKGVSFEIFKVKAHSGNYLNNKIDRIVTSEMRTERDRRSSVRLAV